MVLVQRIVAAAVVAVGIAWPGMGTQAATVVLPHGKGSSVTLSDGLPMADSSERCDTGDYVCELIHMHTSGLLTNHRLNNLTTQLDSTWQRSVSLGVNLEVLEDRVQGEIEDTLELRANVSPRVS